MSDDNEEETPSVVIDNGSGTIKSGIAGDEFPKFASASIFEPIAKHIPFGYAAIRYNGLCYDRSQRKPEISKEDNHPIQRGVVLNWDKMEVVWKNTFKQLDIEPDEYGILMTEAPLTPRPNREKMTQIMFETFEAAKFYVAIDSVLALYAAGRTTGLVISCGYGNTSITPIYEGYLLPHAAQRLEIAGTDITQYLECALAYCYGAKDKTETAKLIKEEFCFIANDEELEYDSNIKAITYELPDGQKIQIGSGRVRACEILFQPSLIAIEEHGIHHLTFESIMKCDTDIRNDLYGNIVMSGGSTLFKGMQKRFTSEISCLAPELTKIKVVAPPERLNSVWIGGSILASLSTFEEMWIGKWEYDESGPSIVHRKCT